MRSLQTPRSSDIETNADQGRGSEAEEEDITTMEENAFICFKNGHTVSQDNMSIAEQGPCPLAQV
jgi:hypothetical protein